MYGKTEKFRWGDCSGKELGESIRAERKALGKTQQWVAEQCSIRRATVCDLERGKNVEVETVFAVLKCLNKRLRIVSDRPALDEIEGIFDHEVEASNGK